MKKRIKFKRPSLDFGKLLEERKFTITPFQDLNDMLPIDAPNSDFVREFSQRRFAIVDDPEKHYKTPFAGTALEYFKEFNDKRLQVASLAQKADKLLKYDILEVFFKEKRYGVTSWPECLSRILGLFAREYEENIALLDDAGQLQWVKVDKPGMGKLEALRTGKCSAVFRDMHSLCRRLQWLFLMCGVSLNTVAVRHNAFTDEEWQRHLAAEAAAKASMEEERKRLIAQQELENARKEKRRKEQDKRRANVKKRKQRPADSVCSTPVLEGTYILVNGVVEFIKPMRGNGNNETRIIRSESDSEDTWKGLGFMARDNGRFGSILGEDFAE